MNFVPIAKMNLTYNGFKGDYPTMGQYSLSVNYVYIQDR